MQRLSAALHCFLGSYLRDALQEGNVDVVACLPVRRAEVFISSFLVFAWWSPLLFLVRNFLIKFIGLQTQLSCERDNNPAVNVTISNGASHLHDN
jgi:hypothetical protein